MDIVKIRALRPDEVELRVAKVTKTGAQFLLYKDSRVDKRILDETFGIFGWQNKYEVVNDNLYCTVQIWDDEKKEWISKCDCGVESYAEKEKGEASDAFKRACFNVGIGRELYTKIFIFIKGITEPDPNNPSKYVLSDPFAKFTVSEMKVDEEKEKIVKLSIQDKEGKIVFSWNGEKSLKNKAVKSENDSQNTATKKVIESDSSNEKDSDYEPLTNDEADILLKAFEARHGKCEQGTVSMEKMKSFVKSFGVKKLKNIPHIRYAEAIAKISEIG